MTEELLTAKELKDQLKVSLPAIRKWTRNGMPCTKLGARLCRYHLSAVVAWLEKKGGGAEVVSNGNSK